MTRCRQNEMRYFFRHLAVLSVSVFSLAAPLSAQQVTVPFGNLKHDASQQVEIVSDTFTISQNRGSAEFTGHVVVGQGDLRLSAGEIKVEYAQKDGKPTGQIGTMTAKGGVTLASGSEAAEAKQAVYSLAKGTIVMEGDVMLTQGNSVLAGQKVTIDLNDGSAKVEGRVKTIFKAGPSK